MRPAIRQLGGIFKLSRRWPTAVLACAVLISCGTVDQAQSPTSPPLPTPSVAPFFGSPATRTPTTVVTQTRTATPRPTSAPTPTTAAATPVQPTTLPESADQYPQISIYDETLNANWSVAGSQNMTVDLGNKAVVHDGKVALVAKPTKAFGKLFFAVRKNTKEVYDSEKVLGLRLWLSGGPNAIANTDLAITVLGSNQYTYWAEGDTSVHVDATITPESPLFSETRLYDLGINRIPPGEWVEVIVWFDKLIYDPPYKYLTGIYIKNDREFADPFYLDHVDLLLQP